jgi:hypothetical protein
VDPKSLTDINEVLDGIKMRMDSGNACCYYYSILKLLSVHRKIIYCDISSHSDEYYNGMLHHVVRYMLTDVSEELTAFIIRVKHPRRLPYL